MVEPELPPAFFHVEPPIPPPVFNGGNHRIWSMRMKTFLRIYGLTDLVEDRPQDMSPGVADDELARKDAMALYLIQLAVDESIFPKIAEATTSHQAWETLREEYSGDRAYVRQNRVDSNLTYKGLLFVAVSIIVYLVVETLQKLTPGST